MPTHASQQVQQLLASAAVALASVFLAACANSLETGPAPAASASSATSTASPRPVRVPAPANTVNVPSSIDATGSKNVSSAMASFINGVPNGSTIAFPAGATYLLDDNGIVLSGRRNLVFAGQGARLEFTGCGTNDSAFKLKDTRGIVIRDFVLVGDNPGSYHAGCESSEGVAMYGAYDTTISRVDVRKPYGHCWYTEQTDVSGWTDGVLIEDSACVGAGVMGVAVVAGRNVTVEGTTFKDTALFPFDIEPHDADGGGEYLTFRDNVVDGYGISTSYTPWVLAAAPDIGSYRNITFERNHVVRGATHGPTLAGLATRMDGSAPKRNIVIRNNTTDVPGKGPVMRFRNVDGLTVSGNEQPLTSGSLTSCTGCTNVATQ